MAWCTLQKYLLILMEHCSVPLRRPATSNNSYLKCSGALCTPKCSLPQGTIISEVLRSKESILGGMMAVAGTPVEMVQVPLSISIPPHQARTCSQVSYQAPPWQIGQECLGSPLIAGQSQGWTRLVWKQRNWGRMGEKRDQELTRERHRLVGKTKCWKGAALFCSNTSFLCAQDKVTRCMIYLARRKQLFGESVGVFRQSCSVPEESHLQTLTASFYPLPSPRFPTVISPSGCAAQML